MDTPRIILLIVSIFMTGVGIGMYLKPKKPL